MKRDEVTQTERLSRRILVVEDDPLIRDLNTRMLMDVGYQVDAVEDGSVAWDTLQVKTFDLLITDNSMPNVTGLELIEKMRVAGIALPVIMATAVLPQEAVTRSPWLRPVATVIKPFTRAEFLVAVTNVMGGTVPIVKWQSYENEIPIVPVWRQLIDDANVHPMPSTPDVKDYIDLDKARAIPEVPSSGVTDAKAINTVKTQSIPPLFFSHENKT